MRHCGVVILSNLYNRTNRLKTNRILQTFANSSTNSKINTSVTNPCLLYTSISYNIQCTDTESVACKRRKAREKVYDRIYFPYSVVSTINSRKRFQLNNTVSVPLILIHYFLNYR